MSYSSPSISDRPFSQACENNQEPIRLVLDDYFESGGSLLEIGSGTGQHAYYMSKHYSQLTWHTSDVKENLPGIEAWVQQSLREGNGENIKSPMQLDINSATWKQEKLDFIYSANTVHIMSWTEVERLFQFLPQALKSKGYFFLYGPFNYDGNFTSDSNARFDAWLKTQAPHRAIRDFEAINALANAQGLSLVKDHEMPANNRLLVWQYDRANQPDS